MSFKIPKPMEEWLNQDFRKPPENFVDCSLYYANLDPFFINYMNRVVRPCMAYATGAADNTYNSGAKMNIGYSIKNTAVKLIKGDKLIFDGDDLACGFIGETWSESVGFETFLESAIDHMLCGGTCAVKLNKDARGRSVPVATRIDRYYSTTDDEGNVLSVIFINSLLYTEKYGVGGANSYWLVEDRHYDEQGVRCVEYKVHLKSGIAGQEILPNVYDGGIPEEGLPQVVRETLRRKGIKVNQETRLPFRDGLGVWLIRRTSNNSFVPGLAMGDPLFYGALDLLWSCDVVFSGSLVDVLLGKGKILVPRRFLGSLRDDLAAMGMKWSGLSERLNAMNDKMSDDDDSLVYIYTENDKDFPPTNVQFDIRAEQYRGMFELYLRQIVSHCGFSPTSVFPFLEDGSAKTATEIRADDNLTRATVQGVHQTLTPVLNRMIAEVLYQSGFTGKAKIHLSDYIGNTLLRDQNIRDNYAAGLIPRAEAVQRVNNLSAEETEEYLAKLEEDDKRKQETSYGGGLFGGTDFFGDGDDGGGGA